MRLNTGQLDSALKRGLAPCYVLAGEEPLLIQEAQDAIRAAAKAQGYSERETLDIERDFDWNHLLETCATGSLFAERRVIELRLNVAAGDAGTKALKHLAEKPPSDVLLLVIAGRLDTRARKGGWYAALERAGAAFYTWPLRSDDFPRWLGQRLQAVGLRADADAVALLAQRTEGNLLAAAQEVTKLALLHPAGRLDLAAVTASVADTAHYGVFDWVDKLMAGDGLGAVRGLSRLREEGEALPALVAVLAMDLRKLAQAAASYARSGDVNAAMASAKVFKMREKGFGRALSRSRHRQVLGWLQRLSGIDVMLKTGHEAAAWEAFMSLALKVSGTGRRRVSA